MELFLNLFEITFLTASHESFAVGLQFVPDDSNFVGFLRIDFVILRCAGNDIEQSGELLNDRTGRGNNFEALLSGALRIHHEVSSGVLAEPFDDGGLSGKENESGQAVQRVT